MALLATLDTLRTATRAATLGAFRAADSMAAAAPALSGLAGENVGFNTPERIAAATYLAAYTRRDQSVGMNAVELALSEAYRRTFTAPSGVRLPGYGPMEDLITLAPFLRRRA